VSPAASGWSVPLDAAVPLDEAAPLDAPVLVADPWSPCWTLSGSVAEFSGAVLSWPGTSVVGEAGACDWAGFGVLCEGVVEPLDCAIATPPTPSAARRAAAVAATDLRWNRSNIGVSFWWVEGGRSARSQPPMSRR
jgi:hypothetical protein